MEKQVYRVEHKKRGEKGWWHSPFSDEFQGTSGALQRAVKRGKELIKDGNIASVRIIGITTTVKVVKEKNWFNLWK